MNVARIVCTLVIFENQWEYRKIRLRDWDAPGLPHIDVILKMNNTKGGTAEEANIQYAHPPLSKSRIQAGIRATGDYARLVG
jgi:hypothetical protein